jgi:hypothetical protein
MGAIIDVCIDHVTAVFDARIAWGLRRRYHCPILMADPVERATSFAKKVKDLHHEENALDRTLPLKARFNPAPEQDNQPPKESDKSGSKMVRQDAPVLRPTPSGTMRVSPDRYAAASKLGKEHDAEEEKLKAALKAKARQRLGQEKDRDEGRER